MKCIQSTTDATDIQRVSDDKASSWVGTGLFKYVPKSVWKATLPPKPAKPAKIPMPAA